MAEIKYMLLLKLEITLPWYNILQWYIYTHKYTQFPLVPFYKDVSASTYLTTREFSTSIFTLSGFSGLFENKEENVRFGSLYERLNFKHFILHNEHWKYLHKDALMMMHFYCILVIVKYYSQEQYKLKERKHQYLIHKYHTQFHCFYWLETVNAKHL